MSTISEGDGLRGQHERWVQAHARLMTGPPRRVLPSPRARLTYRPTSPFSEDRNASFIGPPTRLQWLFPTAIVQLDAQGRVKEPRWLEAGWKKIARQVALKHGCNIKEMRSIRRDKMIVAARHEAFWRCHKELCMSLPQIGRVFGDRDHTTVLHGIRQHEKRMQAACDSAQEKLPRA